EEENDTEEEYEVEKIEGHRLYKGKVVKYEIKWKGYSSSENTVESATTIHADVPDICLAYWDSMPNIDKPSNLPEKKPKENSTSSNASSISEGNKKESCKSNDSAKQIKNYLRHVPKYMIELGYVFPNSWPNNKTRWNTDLRRICVQASPIEPKTMLCYIEWNNGERTIHSMPEVHKKIPEALIQYYEERLLFV
ncbi:MAG: hypothetical protein EXX96DRAFT_475637, partial [Benjaminiella poitrasii]